MERRADEAERETDKLKKAEYMTRTIHGISGLFHASQRQPADQGFFRRPLDFPKQFLNLFGMYVELPNTVEGLIHVSSLRGDYFYYDEANYEMVSLLNILPFS